MRRNSVTIAENNEEFHCLQHCQLVGHANILFHLTQYMETINIQQQDNRQTN